MKTRQIKFIYLSLTLLFITFLSGCAELKRVTVDGKKTWKLLQTVEVEEYDSNGKLIHSKDCDGYEDWHKYDENENEIYSIDQDDIKIFREYNDKGELIHDFLTSGKENTVKEFEEWFQYDSNGNKIYMEQSNGRKIYFDYDPRGNCIHTKDSDGNESWSEYDSANHKIHYRHSNGFEELNVYDDDGKLLLRKRISPRSSIDGYIDDGNDSYLELKNSETHFEYDENGNCILEKNSDWDMTSYEYDSHGNPIHSKIYLGYDLWYVNKYNKNGTLIKTTTYAAFGEDFE